MTLEMPVLRNALNLRCWCPDDPRRPQSWLPGQAVLRVLAQRMYHTQGPARGQRLCCAVMKMEASTVKINLVPDHTASQGQGWPLNPILLMTASCPQHPHWRLAQGCLFTYGFCPLKVYQVSFSSFKPLQLEVDARCRPQFGPSAPSPWSLFGECSAAAVPRLQGASRPAGNCWPTAGVARAPYPLPFLHRLLVLHLCTSRWTQLSVSKLHGDSEPTRPGCASCSGGRK